MWFFYFPFKAFLSLHFLLHCYLLYDLSLLSLLSFLVMCLLYWFLCCFHNFYAFLMGFLHYQCWTRGFPSAKLLLVFSSPPLLCVTVKALELLHNLCSFTTTYVHHLKFPQLEVILSRKFLNIKLGQEK